MDQAGRGGLRNGRAGLLIGLLALAGCGHATSIDNPGDHWLRVDSEHFRVYTDARPVHYMFIVARLENTQKAIKQAFFNNLQTPPLDVLFLNDESLFIALADNVDLAAMFEPSVGESGVLVMRAGTGDDDESM